MGTALAQEASRRGASVVLVLGPVAHQPLASRGMRVVPVVSAWDMYEAVKKHLPRTDYFIGSAAVVDYRPTFPIQKKIKKHQPSVTLRLSGNPDIIATVGHLNKGRPYCVVGFALETDHMLENAHGKLVRKRLDWIVANRESNMGQSEGAGTLLSRWGDHLDLKKMSKDKLAEKIWSAILNNN